MPEDPEDDGFDVEDIPEISFRFVRGGPKRIVTEPSTDQLAEFYSGLTRLQIEANKLRGVEDTKAPENETPEERDDRIEHEIAVNEESSLRMEIERAELYSAVCSGDPSVEELMGLKHRPRRAFYAYVMGMLNPEA